MKWRTLLYTACLVLTVLLVACSNSGKGSTAVTVTISSGGGAHKAGIGMRSKAMNPVTSIRFTISGPGMDTITNTILITPPQTVSQTFYILNGPSRTFLIEAFDTADASNPPIYSGSSTADLNGTPVTISLPLQTLIFNNLITTPWNDEATTITQAQDGNGNLVIAGHTFGDLGDNNVKNADPTHNTPDIFVSKLDSAGATLWTQQVGTNGYDLCYSAATDSVGNIYLTGSTGGNLNGASKSGLIDGYVMKLGPDGTVLWTSLTGTALSITFGTSLAVDSAGNAYITGYTNGILYGLGNGNNFDIFTAKYDATSGSPVWIRQDGSNQDDFGNSIALYPSGAGPDLLYITGSTKGDFNGNANADPAGPGSTTDFFLMKYDSDGLYQWTNQSGTLGASADDDAWAVAIDANGDIYVAGGTTGNLVISLTGLTDLFVIKYEPISGTPLWSQQLGEIGTNTVANAITAYPNTGVVVTGTTDGNLDQQGNAGFNDMFMVEYDQNSYVGNLQQYGTKKDDYGMGVVIDNNGLITIVGNTYGGFTSSATEDVFLQQYPWVTPIVP